MSNTFYSITVCTSTGNLITLDKYKGKVCLIANASLKDEKDIINFQKVCSNIRVCFGAQRKYPYSLFK